MGRCIVLDEKVYNNASLDTPIAPSDTVQNYIDFLERNRRAWGMARNVFVDSADQTTLTELAKYKRANPQCLYLFNNAYKQITIIDRIVLQLGWMNQNEEAGKKADFYIFDSCVNYIRELDVYSWMEKCAACKGCVLRAAIQGNRDNRFFWRICKPVV